MRRIIAAASLTALLSLVGTAPAWADNPFPGPPATSGTPASPGSPNHLCGTSSTGNNPGPGNAPNSQSAFNPTGVGGSTYNPRGQYDVACFQTAGH
ncbi:hypothetical protein ABIA32_003554 [Streptacidiphilus sp. MAP12-20]|uniref:hypothetical protein n=1 Tax=Streptacidiphilus sp. MAP12-20 TaxID=3156299 RepID=UPI0035172EDC